MKINNEYEEILNNFKISDKPDRGACFILPDGKFMLVKTHGTVDEFAMKKFGYGIEEFMDKFPNGIMVDKYNCFRINNGATFSGDKYVQLPEQRTKAQMYSLKDWLDNFVFDSVDVETSENKFKHYNAKKEGTKYILGRIERFYNSGKLVENIIKL